MITNYKKIQDEKHFPVHINLNENQNLFSILEWTKRLSEKFNKNYDQIKSEMFLTNSFDDFIKVFDKHFGFYVLIIINEQ